jgi:hypothetical protein
MSWKSKDNILGWDTVTLASAWRMPSESVFVRVWKGSEYGHAYGKNKFEAYRKAVINYKESNGTFY